MPAERARLVLILFLSACALPAAGQSATRYVSDQFEINLRSGKSGQHAILRVLPTGTPLEVLETDAEAGYARVRTRGGQEGWVLSRYLMTQPPARDRIDAIREQLNAANAELTRQTQALEQLSLARADAEGQAQALRQDNDRLAQELTELRLKAADVLAIDERNDLLQRRVAELERQLAAIRRANVELADRSARDWFIAGAGVVIAGILLGLVVPRIRWGRRSRYGDF